MATSKLPSTIRALLHNLKEQTLTIGSIPLPSPTATQYLIKPYAVAFTVGETLWPRPEELNISSPGVEFAARVVQSPSSTSKFQPGDEVYARVTYPNAGAARQYSTTNDEEIALKPQNISFVEAAAVPVSALTAWQALFENFKLTPPTSSSTKSSKTGKRILITAASGNVGLWATQLAKLAGLYVVGTGGPRNVHAVRDAGADEVLDYTKTSIRTWAEEDPENRKVDFVFDCAGRSSQDQAWHALKEGGQLLSIVPPADMQWKWVLDAPEGVSKGVCGRFFVMHPSGEQLGLVTELIEAGKVKPLVDSVWKFEEYQKAFDRLSSGKAAGKVVLTLDDEN